MKDRGCLFWCDFPGESDLEMQSREREKDRKLDLERITKRANFRSPRARKTSENILEQVQEGPFSRLFLLGEVPLRWSSSSSSCLSSHVFQRQIEFPARIDGAKQVELAIFHFPRVFSVQAMNLLAKAPFVVWLLFFAFFPEAPNPVAHCNFAVLQQSHFTTTPRSLLSLGIWCLRCGAFRKEAPACNLRWEKP